MRTNTQTAIPSPTAAPVRRRLLLALVPPLTPAMLIPVMLLAGCDTLPDSGPVESRILNAEKKPETNPLGFRIVTVTPSVVRTLDSQRPPLLSTLDTLAPGQHDDRIGPGDVLQVSIFELGSGLFAGGGAGALAGSNPLAGGIGPSTAVTTEALPPLSVDGRGMVDVPYVGQLHATGRTPQQLASAIQAGLKGKSQNPQVLVRITADLANSVIVSGDVRKPGREPLTLAHERLLDMIAIAGGPSQKPEDSFVQLVRDGTIGRIPLKTLQDDPEQNIPLLPGDRVQLNYRPRTFTVFGASGKVSEQPFNVADLTLAQALARIGGPLDERADPNAVFLFRFEDPRAASDLGLPVRPGVAAAPVVYRLDMMDPTSYFLAQQFAMKDKDLIFIANAKTNKFYKFFNLISTLIGPGLTAAYLTRD